MRTSGDGKRAGILIQARSNSNRLPGKIYAGLPEPGATPLLQHIYDRLANVAGADVVAVLAPESDSNLIDFCRDRKIPCAVGPEDDVRERYRRAARKFDLDIIVRATGDNPCVDAGVAEDTIREIRERECDLFSYFNLPLGVAVEAFSRDALFRDVEPEEAIHREHVSLHIKHNPADFQVVHLQHPVMEGYPGKPPRLTVDTIEDLRVVRRLFGRLGPNFNIAEVLRLGRLRPKYFQGNEDVPQRTFVPVALG